MDLQHSHVDPKDLVPMFTAIAGKGATPTARVSVNDFTMIGKLLDLGAPGVIVPMVNNAAAVAACRYPPFGRRSAGWLRHPSGSDDVRIVEDVAVILMVETADGLANCEEIAAVPGVDCVYVGPFDLALALGLPLVDRAAEQVRMHSGAIKRVRRACQAAGIVVDMHCTSGRDARAYVDSGYVTVVADLTLIERGREDLAIVRGAG